MKTFQGKYDGKNLKFGVVVSRFNEFITKRLLESALIALEKGGVQKKNIKVLWVPGALEVPFFCKQLKKLGKVDGVVALGCVIRGDTYHYETVCHEMTRGIAQVSFENDIPVTMGVLTTENLEQAIDRAGLKAGNKGGDAALAALEIADLQRQLKKNVRSK